MTKQNKLIEEIILLSEKYRNGDIYMKYTLRAKLGELLKQYKV